MNCSACHQATGQGVTAQFPPLAGSQWVVGDYGRLVRILLHGLQGPVEVRGATYNGNMPAFGNKLDDSQLSMVLSYIRQAWENAAPPISADVIGSIRSQVAERGQAWTSAELTEVNSPPLSEVAKPPDEKVEKTPDAQAAKQPAAVPVDKVE